MRNSLVTDDPTAPLVTLIVIPRERFSCAQESLKEIYRNCHGLAFPNTSR